MYDARSDVQISCGCLSKNLFSHGTSIAALKNHKLRFCLYLIKPAGQFIKC